MSSERRKTRPIRQLSLQQSVLHRDHVQIRRQRSTEDNYGKSLQIYANSIVRRKSATNVMEPSKEPRNSQNNLDIEKSKKMCINIDCFHPSTIFPSLKSENINSIKINNNFSMVKQKRASFRNGTNRAFLMPMMEKSSKEITEKDKTISAKSIEIRCTSAKTTIKSSIDKCTTFTKNSSIMSLRKMRRTNSAPSQTQNIAARMQVNVVIDASSLTEMDKSINCGKIEDKKNALNKDKDLTKISQVEQTIKSTSLKKKSKSAKKRFFTSLNSNRYKDEDVERKKGFIDPRNDVITMVSLISSADSDSDMENSSEEDKLIDELHNKLPTTSIIKRSINTSHGTIKKPIKSVSFQKSSFEISTREEKHIVNDIESSRLNSTINVVQEKDNENLEKKDLVIDNTFVTSTLAAVSALITQDTPTAISETLNNREKKCLAVPIDELYDKKWKLLQAKNTSNYLTVTERMNNSAMEEMKEQKQHFTMLPIDIVTSSSINNSISKVGQFSKEILVVKETLKETSEPYLQTTKEKECWHLYRRMCDKGVYVSFNTVLRGMLTPTEYRMRQKEFSQDL